MLLYKFSRNEDLQKGGTWEGGIEECVQGNLKDLGLYVKEGMPVQRAEVSLWLAFIMYGDRESNYSLCMAIFKGGAKYRQYC